MVVIATDVRIIAFSKYLGLERDQKNSYLTTANKSTVTDIVNAIKYKLLKRYINVNEWGTTSTGYGSHDEKKQEIWLQHAIKFAIYVATSYFIY